MRKEKKKVKGDILVQFLPCLAMLGQAISKLSHSASLISVGANSPCSRVVSFLWVMAPLHFCLKDLQLHFSLTRVLLPLFFVYLVPSNLGGLSSSVSTTDPPF